MPRAKKTQPVQTAAAQAYGVAGEQQAAMNAVPLPAEDFTGGPAGPPGAPAPAPQVNPMEAALTAAQAMTPPGAALDAPTDRPNEPVTAGLTNGAGPGPEALTLLQPGATRPTPVADTFDLIAAANGGNPVLAELANRARQRGV